MKFLTIFLTAVFLTVSFQPALAQNKKDEAKAADFATFVYEYTNARMSYDILAACGVVESNIKSKIETAARRKKDALFKNHYFDKQDKDAVEEALSDSKNPASDYKIEIKEGEPSICDFYLDTAKKNIDTWIK